jgi:SAM-dependent methyltransferase
MDRVAQLLSTSQRSSRIIEVGPSYSPIAPKSAGWNSFVVDHATQAELRAKYRPTGVNVDAIEPVDFVWQTGSMDTAVPAAFHGTFDTLVASHVIEHMPDFIAFFEAAAKLLKPTGTVALAVPDKRFCFDFFRPLSMSGDVIEAHLMGLSRHTRRNAFNHAAHIVSADNVTAWGQHRVHQFAFELPLKNARKALGRWSAEPDAPYRDSHAWQFTPASFELVVLEASLVGMLDWHVVTIYPTAGCEFIALLQPGLPPYVEPATSDEQRMALLRRTLYETREQIDYALGPPELTGEAAARLERIEAALPAIPALLEAQNRRLGELAEVASAPNAAVMERLERLARLPTSDPAVAEQLKAGLNEIAAQLRAQDAQLHEVAEVAFWFRRAVRPVRSLWRGLEPVRRLFRRAPAQPN